MEALKGLDINIINLLLRQIGFLTFIIGGYYIIKTLKLLLGGRKFDE